MRDVFYFWSVLFQILGLTAVARAAADLSWNQNEKLPTAQTSLIFIVLASGIIDIFILLFYTMHIMSRKWTYWLNISQICRVAVLSYAIFSLERYPQNPTNAYYAAIKTVIFSSTSTLLRILDYLKNGSSVNKNRLSPGQRGILVVTFWNFLTMLLGSVILKFIEDWSFSDAWNFVNVTALTIGYGDHVPKTLAGKIIIVTIGNIFIIMAGYLVVTVKDVVSPSRMKQKRNVFLFFVGIITYVIFGATVFMLMEDWNFIDSLFFVWYTLTTVGYGNIVPQRPISWEFWLLYVYSSISFYAFGLGLITNRISQIVNNHNQHGFNNNHVQQSNNYATHQADYAIEMQNMQNVIHNIPS